ncbi:MAG: GNAT family N-acetyltransferase [Rhodocyclaceae bacterium]|nr:GNAT family N-acetyltransferase [Rhodocyclaceae bacterium]
MRNRVELGYTPGVIGRVAELHGRYYSRHFGFGSFFEARVAADVADFFRSYNPDRDLFLAMFEGADIIGSIAVDGSRAARDGAQLRWFIVDESVQGHGVGKLMLNSAVAFCRQHRYGSIYLETFVGLDVARHLYEQAGFKLTREAVGSQYGTRVVEQRFELPLDHPAEAPRRG